MLLYAVYIDLTVHPPPQNDQGWVHFFRMDVCCVCCNYTDSNITEFLTKSYEIWSPNSTFLLH